MRDFPADAAELQALEDVRARHLGGLLDAYHRGKVGEEKLPRKVDLRAWCSAVG